MKREAVLLGILMLAVPAMQAQTFIDFNTLHVFCTLPTPACLDNGTITPTTTNPPTFGFIRSPNTNSGLLSPTIELEILVPNNKTVLPFTVTGTNTGNAAPVAPVLFSATAWTTGDLVGTYLGLQQSGGPTNPIGAYLPSTQAVDAGATGFFAYQANFGAVTFGTTTDPTFVTSAVTFPVGTVILALIEGPSNNTQKGHCPDTTKICVQDATANSSALIITGGGGGGGGKQPVPEPSAMVLLGSGLLFTCIKLRKKMAHS